MIIREIIRFYRIRNNRVIYDRVRTDRVRIERNRNDRVRHDSIRSVRVRNDCGLQMIVNPFVKVDNFARRV